MNVINKDLVNPFTTNITLRNDIDIVNPRLRLYLLSTNDIFQYNYARLFTSNNDINRYYFINEYRSINFELWEVALTCDVLETYKTEILAANCRYMRNIETGDYQQANIETKVRADISVINSDAGFNGEPSMILTTIGGVPNA